MRLFAGLFTVLVVAQECSIYKAATAPTSVALEKVHVGGTRTDAISVFGQPKYTCVAGDKQTDLFEFVDGHHGASKLRIILYAAGDFFTLGAAELLFWPMELRLFQGSEGRATVTYRPDNVIRGMQVTKKDETPSSPPSEKVRAQLGTIGVASAESSPATTFEMPPKGLGTEARKGAVKGAITSISEGITLGARAGAKRPIASAGYIPVPGLGLVYGLALGTSAGVVLAAPAALAGGVYGAAAAEPAASVEEAETQFTEALTNIQEAIRDHVFLMAREETGRPLVLLQGSSTRTGTDTVLEIGVRTIELKARKSITPPVRPLRLALIVEVRLIRSPDGEILYSHIFEYTSTERSFAQWTANDAQLFHEEFPRAYRSLAGHIVQELFWRCPYPIVEVPDVERTVSPVQPGTSSRIEGLPKPVQDVMDTIKNVGNRVGDEILKATRAVTGAVKKAVKPDQVSKDQL